MAYLTKTLCMSFHTSSPPPGVIVFPLIRRSWTSRPDDERTIVKCLYSTHDSIHRRGRAHLYTTPHPLRPRKFVRQSLLGSNQPQHRRGRNCDLCSPPHRCVTSSVFNTILEDLRGSPHSLIHGISYILSLHACTAPSSLVGSLGWYPLATPDYQNYIPRPGAFDFHLELWARNWVDAPVIKGFGSIAH